MQVTQTEVRGLKLTLAAHTRALALCARMNRELEILDFIDAIAPGEVFFDLGACEGRFSVYAALRGALCHAFEPERENFQTLLANAGQNAVGGRLLAHPVAVGARCEKAVLSIGQPWAGGHHKVLRGESPRTDLSFAPRASQEVTVVSLDRWVAEGRLPEPRHLKVDVDGSERAFLEGARGILSGERARRLMIELYLPDSDQRAVAEELTALGWERRREYPVEEGLYNVLFER